MDKHHSYNNLVERKLQQLPAPDTDGLWSNMEAILDQQLPPKKRRPGLLGWLFANKAWMVATLVVGTAAGTTLVYTSGDKSPAAQPVALTGTTAPGTTAPAFAAPAATPSRQEAAATGQVAGAPVATAAEASATTTSHLVQNTIPHTAAPNLSTASVPPTTSVTDNHTTAGNEGTPVVAATASSAMPVTAVDPNVVAQPEEEGTSSSIHWAKATKSIALQPSAAPSVDPARVRQETGSLENLSQQIAASAAAARQSGRLPQEKGPYVGVVVGLDLSSVEFGSMQTGNNKGLLVGYAFNNRWSAETGLLWSRKNYSADGSYYKADGYTPQPGLTILNVNSVNQVFELPLNVKYNIVARRNQLFATAGVSSYLMRKELVDLSYEYNGQRGSEYNTYSNESKHWLSVASFSLGYTYRLGSFGSLRVEPYVKLPLKDLGVSNMRLTSTGLNVGFIKMLRQ